MGRLYDLPDELLLEVVRFLAPTRSYETQSTAFRIKELEKSRQCGNKTGQKALHALCLTSRRLRHLSTPTLYSSSITCATPSGLRALQLLHRTITSPGNTLDQTKHLSEYLRYIENRLADYQGDSLQDDVAFQERALPTYFQLLAELVLLAPNIEHICVVSVEFGHLSFWPHVLNQPQGLIVRHGFLKLKHLFAQIHAQIEDASPEPQASELIIQSLQSWPLLSDLQISGDITKWDGSLRPAKRTFNLSRLKLTEHMLHTDEVASLLLACKALQHFTCTWAYYPGFSASPPLLHSALLAHATTLETLEMDWRKASHTLDDDPNTGVLGSLRPFEALRLLQISDVGFLSTKRSLLEFPGGLVNDQLAALLPGNLERMTLLTAAARSPPHEYGLEDLACLWRLARDCSTYVPHFKTLCVKARHVSPEEIFAVNLACVFERVGVELHVQQEQSKRRAVDSSSIL